MNRNELEQLFGNALNDAEILHMAKNWNEWDVNQYLIDTGYNADCKDVINSLRREARSIAAAAMGSTRSERKAASSRANGRQGGRPAPIMMVNPWSKATTPITWGEVKAWGKSHVHPTDYPEWIEAARQAFKSGDGETIGKMIIGA